MIVFVFKTNLFTNRDVDSLSKQLDANEEIVRWNVDLDDCDRILRVESPLAIQQMVTQILRQNGYHCEKLTD